MIVFQYYLRKQYCSSAVTNNLFHDKILIHYLLWSQSKNKGIGVENYHYLNDGLWNMPAVKN